MAEITYPILTRTTVNKSSEMLSVKTYSGPKKTALNFIELILYNIPSIFMQTLLQSKRKGSDHH